MTFGLKSDFLQVMVERGCHNVSLASGVISACIGYDAAAESEETANRGFEEGGAGYALPIVRLDPAVVEARAAARLLVAAGIAAFCPETKRLIAEGDIRLSDALVANSGAPLPPDMPATTLKVSVGETRRVLVGAGRSGETVA